MASLFSLGWRAIWCRNCWLSLRRKPWAIGEISSDYTGEILADELDEIDIKPTKLASEIDVPVKQIHQILSGKDSITADMALRLGKFFNTGPELWLNLQKAYDLEIARQKIGNRQERITPYQGKVPSLVPAW